MLRTSILTAAEFVCRPASRQIGQQHDRQVIDAVKTHIFQRAGRRISPTLNDR
jgi:hypothetical protein